MKPIHKRRLLKLAAFLDKLPRERFDIRVIQSHRPCGTVGCAIGWTPKVFPRLVEWTDLQAVCPRSAAAEAREAYGYTAVADYLFGVGGEDARGLFSSAWPANNRWSPQPLAGDATPKQVAASIRRFIKWKEKQP